METTTLRFSRGLSHGQYMFVLVFAALFVSCTAESSQLTDTSTPDSEIRLGMSEAEFLSTRPNAQSSGSGRYEIRGREFGISGVWIYGFGESGLSWYLFNGGHTEASEINFNRTYRATAEIINEYTGRFGQPWREEKGLDEFINPNTTGHKGYKVREARRRTPDGELIVDFSFKGEAGVYSLSLRIQASS